MPGRLIQDAADAAALFGPFGATHPGPWRGRYNVGPGQGVDVVCVRDGAVQVRRMRWGITSRQPGIGGSHKFCRSETARDKAPFKAAMETRRCIVPITGWYEWPKPKECHCVRPAHGPLALAGIYEVRGEDMFVVLTCEPNSFVKPLHHRMGVFLEHADVPAWLDPSTPEAVIDAMLKQCPNDWFTEFRVSNRAARLGNDDLKCVTPLSEKALKRKPKPQRYGGMLGNMR
jgi:putative SOS response-associated peptidase YedK